MQVIERHAYIFYHINTRRDPFICVDDINHVVIGYMVKNDDGGEWTREYPCEKS